MGSNCCKGDAAGKPVVRSTSSIYTRRHAGATLDDRFSTSQDSRGVRLTISAATTDDSGVYTLQASNAAGTDTTRVRLEVSPEDMPSGDDPPTFLRRLHDLTVKVGTRTRFLVEIISSSECRVTWYRNERRLLEAERIALVRDGNFWCADIAAVSVDDAGRWTCTAENNGGRASCSAHLNVLVPKAYKRPEFVEELRALLTEQGTVSLECKVIGVPTPVLRWFKDSCEIKAGDVFALTANAEDPTSLGTYTCEAVNCMGRAYSSSKVHVLGQATKESITPSFGGAQEPPPIFTKELEDRLVRICERLNLGCNIVVPPWPRAVVWYNKEGKIEPSERYHVLEDGVGGYMIEVPSSEYCDEGEWKCVATSSGGRVGISTCYVSMEVPKNYRKPRFMENLQAILTEEGLVSFECKVVGFPTPVLSWFKDGQELKPGDVYQLTGTNSLGSYCCIARNCMGQASSSAELSVEDIQNQLNEEEKLQLFTRNQAPKILQGLKSVEAKIDEPFRFTVQVAIPPEPSVLWYRDDQPVDETSRCHLGKEDRGVFFLDIQNLELLDQAEWKCVAMNDYGHSVTSCFLKLIIPRHYKKPRFLENLQAILSDEGAVNLECKVIGVPQPVLKWYKDGEELKPGDIHRIVSGQDGTCCLGNYTCEAHNCMGIAASSASLLGFEDSLKNSKKKIEDQALQRNLSLSTIHEERTSQMYDTPVGDITLDDKGEISFSFDGKEVSVSLYETPDLTEEEALQIVEMYADQLSENVTEHNVIELPPLRFVKETSTSGNLLMEAIIIDVSPEYFNTPDEDLRTEADIDDISIVDENAVPQLSLDQDVSGEDYLEKTMALLSDEKSDFPKKMPRKKSDSQKSIDDFYSLSRDQSISESKKEDDTQPLSESFASAHSLDKAKSKSLKQFMEEDHVSSDLTNTVLLKEEIMSSQKELIKARRRTFSSRRSSSGSDKSAGKLREKDDVKNLERKTCESDHIIKKTNELKPVLGDISTSLTNIINDVQLIEKDIIVRSQLMSSTTAASRSLEIINSIITPTNEILCVIDAIKATLDETIQLDDKLLNTLPNALESLQQSLTVLEKCIEVENENKTLVQKTCILFVKKCGEQMIRSMQIVQQLVTNELAKVNEICLSKISTQTSKIKQTICSATETVEKKQLKIENKEGKVVENVEIKHLNETQKALHELRIPLNLLLNVIENSLATDFTDLYGISYNEVILNNMSTSIQDLQNALEYVDNLALKESSTNLKKYNTEIIDRVMNSVLKLRTSFEQLSTISNNTNENNTLREVLTEIKLNLSDISVHLDQMEKIVGTFDVITNENKLEVLQKVAQVLISLENNLILLEPIPDVQTSISIFHSNLTKVLENVIESNNIHKYFTLMEVSAVVNRVNATLKNLDSDNKLCLIGIIDALKIIQENVTKNVFTQELNTTLIKNIGDIIISIQKTINKADSMPLLDKVEHTDDMVTEHYGEESKATIITEHIDKAVAAINNMISLESISELTFKHALENISPVLENLKFSVAALQLNKSESEQILQIPESLEEPSIAKPLYDLQENISVLSQFISENVETYTSGELIKSFGESLLELNSALEILQQDVNSQVGDSIQIQEINSSLANVVQSIRSCILIIREQGGFEIADDLSTLDDISGIKTTAESLPVDHLILPSTEENTIGQSVDTLTSIPIPAKEIALELHKLNHHIMVVQNPQIVEVLDSLSEDDKYAGLKLVIPELKEVHQSIDGNIPPVLLESTEELTNILNMQNLVHVVQPLKHLQQSLCVVDASNIPISESVLQIPTDQLCMAKSSLLELKSSLEHCLSLLLPTLSITDESIDLSKIVDNLREKVKNILQTLNDESEFSMDVLHLKKLFENFLEASNTSIDIAMLKNLIEILFEALNKFDDEILGYVSSDSLLDKEINIIECLHEVERSIAVLEEHSFIDFSLPTDIDFNLIHLKAMVTEADSLRKAESIKENIIHVIQDSTYNLSQEDNKILESFFKNVKNKILLLNCIIQKRPTHKRIIRLIQDFFSLNKDIKEFEDLKNEIVSEETNICVTNFLTHSEEFLSKFRLLLLNILDTERNVLLEIPMSNINSSFELYNNLLSSDKHVLFHELFKMLLNLSKLTMPFLTDLQSSITVEINTMVECEFLCDNDVNRNMSEIKNHIINMLQETQFEETYNILFKNLLTVIEKHEDYKKATKVGKKLILIKLLSECYTIIHHNCMSEDKKPIIANIKEKTLKDILFEIKKPLDNLHNELLSMQEQVSYHDDHEDSISIDMSSSESYVQALSEINEVIEDHLKNNDLKFNDEDISLVKELGEELHSIETNLMLLEHVNTAENILLPITEIGKSFNNILSLNSGSEQEHDVFATDVVNQETLEPEKVHKIDQEATVDECQLSKTTSNIESLVIDQAQKSSTVYQGEPELEKSSELVQETKAEEIFETEITTVIELVLEKEDIKFAHSVIEDATDKTEEPIVSRDELELQKVKVIDVEECKHEESGSKDKSPIKSLTQHIELYIDMIEHTKKELVPFNVPLENIERAVHAAKELLEYIAVSQNVDTDLEYNVIVQDLSPIQAHLAQQLKEALESIQNQGLCKEEYYKETHKKVLQVIEQLHSDLVTITAHTVVEDIVTDKTSEDNKSIDKQKQEQEIVINSEKSAYDETASTIEVLTGQPEQEKSSIIKGSELVQETISSEVLHAKSTSIVESEVEDQRLSTHKTLIEHLKQYIDVIEHTKEELYAFNISLEDIDKTRHAAKELRDSISVSEVVAMDSESQSAIQNISPAQAHLAQQLKEAIDSIQIQSLCKEEDFKNEYDSDKYQKVIQVIELLQNDLLTITSHTVVEDGVTCETSEQAKSLNKPIQENETVIEPEKCQHGETVCPVEAREVEQRPTVVKDVTNHQYKEKKSMYEHEAEKERENYAAESKHDQTTKSETVPEAEIPNEQLYQKKSTVSLDESESEKRSEVVQEAFGLEVNIAESTSNVECIVEEKDPKPSTILDESDTIIDDIIVINQPSEKTKSVIEHEESKEKAIDAIKCKPGETSKSVSEAEIPCEQLEQQKSSINTEKSDTVDKDILINQRSKETNSVHEHEKEKEKAIDVVECKDDETIKSEIVYQAECSSEQKSTVNLDKSEPEQYPELAQVMSFEVNNAESTPNVECVVEENDPKPSTIETLLQHIEQFIDVIEQTHEESIPFNIGFENFECTEHMAKALRDSISVSEIVVIDKESNKIVQNLNPVQAELVLQLKEALESMQIQSLCKEEVVQYTDEKEKYQNVTQVIEQLRNDIVTITGHTVLEDVVTNQPFEETNSGNELESEKEMSMDVVECKDDENTKSEIVSETESTSEQLEQKKSTLYEDTGDQNIRDIQETKVPESDMDVTSEMEYKSHEQDPPPDPMKTPTKSIVTSSNKTKDREAVKSTFDEVANTASASEEEALSVRRSRDESFKQAKNLENNETKGLEIMTLEAPQEKIIKYLKEFTSDVTVDNVRKVTSIFEEFRRTSEIAKSILDSIIESQASSALKDELIDNAMIPEALAAKLCNSINSLQSIIILNVKENSSLKESDILRKLIKSIITLKSEIHLVTSNLDINDEHEQEPSFYETGDISLKKLEKLLYEVKEQIIIHPTEVSIERQDAINIILEEVQILIIKLKQDYDKCKNDTLNETLEDLECSVRSVQLQLVENGPADLLKEACLTLISLVANIYETEASPTADVKKYITENILQDCLKQLEETETLLKKLEQYNTHNKLGTLVYYLNTLMNNIKSLKIMFTAELNILIDKGIGIIQTFDQIEDMVFRLDKEIESVPDIESEVRENVTTATHFIYMSLSNMRSSLNSIQKHYMYEHYGCPCESFLRSLKQIAIIAKIDEQLQWKILAKSLRQVLNHFEDIKFYINFDKTARLPNDAAFTKVILEDLKTAIYDLLYVSKFDLDLDIDKSLLSTLNFVEQTLINLEDKHIIEVREKIPIFCELSQKVLLLSASLNNIIKEKVENNKTLFFVHKDNDEIENALNIPLTYDKKEEKTKTTFITPGQELRSSEKEKPEKIEIKAFSEEVTKENSCSKEEAGTSRLQVEIKTSEENIEFVEQIITKGSIDNTTEQCIIEEHQNKQISPEKTVESSLEKDIIQAGQQTTLLDIGPCDREQSSNNCKEENLSNSKICDIKDQQMDQSLPENIESKNMEDEKEMYVETKKNREKIDSCKEDIEVNKSEQENASQSISEEIKIRPKDQEHESLSKIQTADITLSQDNVDVTQAYETNKRSSLKTDHEKEYSKTAEVGQESNVAKVEENKVGPEIDTFKKSVIIENLKNTNLASASVSESDSPVTTIHKDIKEEELKVEKENELLEHPKSLRSVEAHSSNEEEKLLKENKQDEKNIKKTEDDKSVADSFEVEDQLLKSSTKTDITVKERDSGSKNDMRSKVEDKKNSEIKVKKAEEIEVTYNNDDTLLKSLPSKSPDSECFAIPALQSKDKLDTNEDLAFHYIDIHRDISPTKTNQKPNDIPKDTAKVEVAVVSEKGRDHNAQNVINEQIIEVDNNGPPLQKQEEVKDIKISEQIKIDKNEKQDIGHPDTQKSVQDGEVGKMKKVKKKGNEKLSSEVAVVESISDENIAKDVKTDKDRLLTVNIKETENEINAVVKNIDQPDQIDQVKSQVVKPEANEKQIKSKRIKLDSNVETETLTANKRNSGDKEREKEKKVLEPAPSVTAAIKENKAEEIDNAYKATGSTKINDSYSKIKNKDKEIATSSKNINDGYNDNLLSGVSDVDTTHINKQLFESNLYKKKTKSDEKERTAFIDYNLQDYSSDLLRPPTYIPKSSFKDEPSLHIQKPEKTPIIYKAQSLLQESQLRSTTPQPLLTSIDKPSRTRQRSKPLSECDSTISDRRTGMSRDLKKRPSFSTFLTDRTAVEGSRVKLTCSVLSPTEPTVTWYKNGVALENKQKYKSKYTDGLITLEVLNAVPTDSAEYKCTVANDNGSITTSANLKVYPSFEATPIPPTFTRSIRDTYHLAENELVLECRIRGQPLPTITWFKDQVLISSQDRYHSCYLADGVCRLVIDSPTTADSGIYTCKAENSMWSDQITHTVQFTGRESQTDMNITTLSKSRFHRQVLESRRPHFTNVLSDYKVSKGGTIGLQVEIRGSPTRVEWLREGRSVIDMYKNAQTYVDQETYTLALTDVTERDSGLFTCRAWSSYGNVDMNASVTVVQPTEIEGKPAIIVSRPSKDIQISVGEDINISFRVQGEPKPKVIIMKGIRDVTNSQRVCKMVSDDYVKFTLKRSIVSDAGTYCILARNAYGCDRAFVTVTVRQRASSDNLISDWTYPSEESSNSTVERNYKSVPDRIPGEPSIVDGGNNWISIAWPKSDHEVQVPVLAYKIESWLLGKEGGARWTELGITPRNTFDAFNLKQGEEYHFRVTPKNRYGWGEPVQTSRPISIGCSGERPEFVDILPGQLKVLVGETATLSCSFKGQPTPEIVWMKNGHEIDEEANRVKITPGAESSSLKIEDVRLNDEGRYSCEATNAHGRASTYARMTVITDKQVWAADAKLKRERSAGVEGDYPPQFTMRLRDRRVQATYPVRLTCQVIGSPPPTVTWFKNGELVIVDGRHSTSQDEFFYTLEIAPTSLDDGGVYEAMARNGCGAISCRCSLVVDKGIRAYVAPEFCCGLEPLYRLKEGEELRIAAMVEAYPSVGVAWYRDGVRLRPSRRAIMTLDRDGQIELAVASISTREAGVYSCTASNEVGTATTSGKVEVIEGEGGDKTRTPPVVISPDVPYSKEPMFIRKPRSSEAYEGDTVIIECEVIGDPKPDVYWLRDFLKPDYYRDAIHFKRVGGGPEYRLEIPHAKLDFTGAYSVVARNVHGEAKAIISLQILAKDPSSSDEAHNVRYGRVDVIPRFDKELTDLLCHDGDTVEFECHVSGNPEPDIRWYHYNEIIPDGSEFESSYEMGAARLRIRQVAAEDEGTYTCTATNTLGKATSNACLVVYPPGEPNTLSQRLRRPPALLSAASTPRSTPRTTPRTTPARSASRTPGPDARRLRSPARDTAPNFYTYPFNKVVEEGETVVFKCAVKGLPTPWATWDKDGIPLTPTARITIKEKDEMLRILEIEEVTIEDVGLYRITLENDYGRVEASARLEVITQRGKFYGSTRSYSPSPRRSLPFRRRTPSLSRYE